MCIYLYNDYLYVCVCVCMCVLQASTVQELGECLVEAQRNMNSKYLKGIMQPSKKLIPVPAAEGSEAPIGKAPQTHTLQEDQDYNTP